MNPVAPSLLSFQNGEDRTAYGLEAEGLWDITDTIRLKANYAYNEFEDAPTSNLGIGPRHQVYAEARWEFAPQWFINANVKAVLDRERAAGDTRPPVDDFTVVNLSLRRKNVLNALDVALSVRNLLNEDARDPSTGPTALPFDIPLADRNLYGEIRVHF